MHFWMGISLIFGVMATQILIVVWKEKHYSSYRQFTMWGEFFRTVLCHLIECDELRTIFFGKRARHLVVETT